MLIKYLFVKIMKKSYTLILFYFVIANILSGCKNNNKKFEYIVDKKEVRLLLENNYNHIKYNEIVPVKFLIKGIKLNQLRIFGPGISISSENDSTLNGSILVKQSYSKSFPNLIKNDTFHIKILIVEEHRKNNGEILVPLKKN